VDSSAILNAVVQFVLVTGVSFLVLCLLASVIRFYELSSPALLKQRTPAAEPDLFQIRVAQRISTAYRMPRPFGVFMVVFPPAAAEPAAAGAATELTARRAALVRGVLRRTDVVQPLSDGVVGVLVDADRSHLPVVARRLQAALQAAGGADGPAAIGGASCPENGLRGPALMEQARAAATAEGAGWQLAAAPGGPAVEPPEPPQGELLDQLTGVLLQEQVARVMQKYVATHRRDNRPVSLLYLDVDHLGRYNEHYGRAAGDAILHQLGELLQRQVREEDLIGRCGDDEFLVLLDCGPADGVQVGQRLVNQIKKTPVNAAGQVLKVTVSGGVAGYPDHGTTARVLFPAARQALLLAQERGRNICVGCERPQRPVAVVSAAGTDRF